MGRNGQALVPRPCSVAAGKSMASAPKLKLILWLETFSEPRSWWLNDAIFVEGRSEWFLHGSHIWSPGHLGWTNSTDQRIWLSVTVRAIQASSLHKPLFVLWMLVTLVGNLFCYRVTPAGPMPSESIKAHR